MAMRVETNALEAAYAALLTQDSMALGRRSASWSTNKQEIKRARHLQAQPYERSGTAPVMPTASSPKRS